MNGPCTKKNCSAVFFTFVHCTLYNGHASALCRETLQQSLNIDLQYQCCRDPLSFRQLTIASSWMPCSDTRMQQIYILFVLASCWGVLMLLNIPSDTATAGSDGI